ncbi:hypothetical protein, partial [Bacillus toyonensis]
MVLSVLVSKVSSIKDMSSPLNMYNSPFFLLLFFYNLILFIEFNYFERDKVESSFKLSSLSIHLGYLHSPYG